jgi:hypothetical protein
MHDHLRLLRVVATVSVLDNLACDCNLVGA